MMGNWGVLRVSLVRTPAPIADAEPIVFKGRVLILVQW